MSTKAVHVMQVAYMAKPINFASLKFPGRLRVLIAYTVHRSANSTTNENEVITYFTLEGHSIST